MDVLLIAAFAVAACIIAVTLKDWQPNIAILISAAAGVMLTVYIVLGFVPYIPSITAMTGIPDGSIYMTTLLKAVGICAVAGTASDVCRDAGQNALASRVDIGGRICVVIVSLPLFSKLLEEATGIING